MKKNLFFKSGTFEWIKESLSSNHSGLNFSKFINNYLYKCFNLKSNCDCCDSELCSNSQSVTNVLDRPITFDIKDCEGNFTTYNLDAQTTSECITGLLFNLPTGVEVNKCKKIPILTCCDIRRLKIRNEKVCKNYCKNCPLIGVYSYDEINYNLPADQSALENAIIDNHHSATVNWSTCDVYISDNDTATAVYLGVEISVEPPQPPVTDLSINVGTTEITWSDSDLSENCTTWIRQDIRFSIDGGVTWTTWANYEPSPLDMCGFNFNVADGSYILNVERIVEDCVGTATSTLQSIPIEINAGILTSFLGISCNLTAKLFDENSGEYLDCPMKGPFVYLFNGTSYTMGMDDAALKAAIEAYYNVTVEYNLLTCTFTQTGGNGSLPINGQIPVQQVTTCKVINLAQVTKIPSSNVCNSTPDLNDVTTWATNTRFITDNSNPAVDVAGVTYELTVYNPNNTLKSSTMLLSNAPVGSSTPSFNLANGERFVMTKVVTDIEGCKHFNYEYNTAFDDLYCFADFAKYAVQFPPYTLVQDSPYIQSPLSAGGIRLGCDIVGVNEDKPSNYINIEVSCRTISPLHTTEVTLSNLSTTETYTFVLLGDNHLQLKNEAEITSYFPSGFTQGDSVQWRWKIQTINDVAAGTYAEYLSSIVIL